MKLPWEIHTGLLFVLLMWMKVISSEAYAQQKGSFFYADSLTYALYEQQQWGRLYQEGKKAIGQSHDYYYIRMRVGIAAFHLSSYRIAAKHFEKALSFNSGSYNSFSYLYYSYLWGGMHTDANNLRKRFPTFARRLKLSREYLQGFTIVAGGIYSQALNTLSSIDLIGDENVYGEGIAGGHTGFAHVGLVMHPVPHLQGYASLNHVRQNIVQRVQLTDLNPFNYDFSLTQTHLSGILPMPISRGWQFIPAISMIFYTQAPLSITYDPNRDIYLFRENPISTFNYIVSAGLQKDFARFNLGVTAANSNFQNNQQWQLTFSNALFPFANLNLYLLSQYSILNDQGEDRRSYRFTLGGRISPKLWIETMHQSGDLRNTHDSHGLTLLNTTSVIQDRSSVKAIILAFPKTQFSIEYTLTNLSDSYFKHLNGTDFQVSNYTFNNQIFTFGLTHSL